MVSVVIPCYNSGEFIDETIDSVLRQTYRDLEIIVVDDGSTDEVTRQRLHDNPWDRTQVIWQENQGPAAARNAGIRAAQGEFILPLDADDCIHPTYIEKALAVIQSRSEVGAVYCKAMRFGKEQGIWDLPDYSLRHMVIDNIVFCTALYRKKDWERVGGYDESMRHGIEDYEFWIRFLTAGLQIYQLDEILFYYRTHEISRTTKFIGDNQSVVDTYAYIFRRNRDFFAEHAEIIYQHRFELYREIERQREIIASLSRINTLIQKIPGIRRVLRKVWQIFFAKT